MKLARTLLLVGALLLLATAAFHSSGSDMVAGHLPGMRGRIVEMLWFVPPIDWLVVALCWAFVAVRADRRLRPIVWITALIPLAVAVMLAATIGIGFPGLWMLVAAIVLGVIGASRLP